jgi:hypothetical protein
VLTKMPNSASHPSPLSAVLAMAIFVALAAAAPSVDAAARPLNTGVSYVYSFDNEPAAFENVKQAGAKLILTPLSWGRITPKQEPVGWQPDNPADPNYNWDAYDIWVRRAVEAGLTPVLQVRGAPLWASRCATVEVDSPCNPDPGALAAFTTAAVSRYSGYFGDLPRVRYWQGLNEPNLSLFFNPQYEGGKVVSPDVYRGLINTFYAAVKAVHPSNLVIAAGLGPIAVPRYTIGPMRFTRELLCMRGHNRPKPIAGNCEGGVHFDIYDIHPYTTGSPDHEGGVNDVQLGDLGKLKNLLSAADRAGRIKGRFERTPLWATELSWDTAPPDPGGLPMAIASRWTAEALHRAWRAGVSDFFWFSLRDFDQSELPSHESLESGLFFRGATVAQDTPKEVLYAFRFPFVAYAHRRGKPALDVWGRSPNSRGGRVWIQVWRGSKWRRIATVRATRTGIFRGRLRTGYGRRGKGRVRAIYHGEATVPFSMRPVRDFYQPPFGAPVG